MSKVNAPRPTVTKGVAATAAALLITAASSAAPAQTAPDAQAGHPAQQAPSAASPARSAPGSQDSASAIAQPAPSPDPQPGPAGGLEDVIVTARRRSENLQNVPVAVTAVTAQTLQAAGIGNTREIALVVPGYVGSRQYSGLQPTIRGVGSTGVSVGDEANVAVYVDGLYIPSAYLNVTDLVDVERVEVLRGPQGTLFGRNATGGLVNLITPDPSFTTQGRVAASYGRFRGANTYQFQGRVTGALGADLAGEVAVSYRHNDAYIRNLGVGGDLGRANVGNYRAKLLWTPGAKSRIILTAAYSDTNDNAANSAHVLPGYRPSAAAVPGNLYSDQPFTTALSLAPEIHSKGLALSLRTSFDLGFASLETTGGYVRVRVTQQSDADFTTANISSNRLDPVKDDVFSQEIRLLSTASGPFKWIAGVYGYHSTDRAVINLFAGAAPTYTAASLKQTTLLTPHATVNALAGFAEGTYSLTDRLDVTLGARYSTERRTFSVANFGTALFPEAKTTNSRWTYRGSVKYSISPHANIYATYSTGFKSAVFNTYGTSPIPTRPETIKAIELGLKADPLPWLRTNIAAFHYDYNDLQVTARDPVVPSLYRLLNAAQVKIKGAELEVEAAATDELKLRFAGSLLDGKYDKFPLAQILTPLPAGGNSSTAGDVSGKQLIRAPKYTLSLGAVWTKDSAAGRLTIGANAFHSARVYYDFANYFSQAPYTMVNADVAFALPGDHWRFRLAGTNLTDARVVQQIGPVSPLAAYSNDELPLRVIGTVEFRF